MQRYCTELTDRLLKSLDKEYNVVDMGAVVDVITALEKTTITKEVLEITRLGKYINELRRKTNNDALAKRAKDLVRRWRDMVLPSAHSTPQPTPADTAPPALNGAKPHSPALRCFKPQSPALRGLIPPQSPLLRDTTPLRVLSPVLSVHSDHSHSPNASSNKQSITVTSNHRTSSDVPPTLGSSSQHHSMEAVPRTHSSNKRLRKDDLKDQHNYQHHDSDSITESESFIKKQRLNGENISGNLNMQVPSPTFKERISDQFMESSTDPDVSGPKKRGRKKGSKSMKKQPVLEDRVKEKLASISRNPKLKTTQELLADLRARGTNSSINSSAQPSQSVESSSMEDILRNSNEQVSKFLRGPQNNLSHRNTVSKASPESRLKPTENCHDVPSKCEEAGVVYKEKSVTNVQNKQPEQCRDLTVEEILAKLPPIDPSSIDWSECETEPTEDQNTEYPPRQVTAEDIERLHVQCVEGLNGNFQPKLSSLTSTSNEKPEIREESSEINGVNNVHNRPDEEFREWHQMLARPSCNGQILHILPYVIID
ncbi:mediator of RNA polymerase II transcription subunit 26 isoform X1 [Frieseomelitta varia]|uniref:mediator of RNA polymerase II transcription subunit 26 isoform X1 n=2 Tax=Frieseomelitta varia TaxID=561572 RepID=UPI001CB6AA4B|nr:mediator of RNA polymerase II transcription subunit 26 isoform X1 [Frieseomelitta varia]